jgi:hypothetical protein
MSKIVVDQIQKSGGPALTLPTTSAGAANSLVVADASQNLSFTTLGNLLPSGTSGQFLKTDGSGGFSFGTVSPNPPSTVGIIGAVRSSSAQSNTYTLTWSSSGPYTTYQNYQIGSNANSTLQAWNMFLGDGYPDGTSQITYANNRDNQYQRELLFANNDRIGHKRDMQYYDNNTTDDYTGVTWMVIPIRNTTSSAITRSISWHHSSDWSSYGGASMALYTPNATTLAATTGGTWSQPYYYQSSTNGVNGSGSITIPANTTVLLMIANTHNYNTTYRFVDTSIVYGLSTVFTGGIVCDIDMLYALQMARSTSNTSSSANPHQIYTACAAMFGDK